MYIYIYYTFTFTFEFEIACIFTFTLDIRTVKLHHYLLVQIPTFTPAVEDSTQHIPIPNRTDILAVLRETEE